MSAEDNRQWYETWFNSKYYHALYKNRNNEEAERFLNNLSKDIISNQNSNILDLGCGKGRHSKYLSCLGHKVKGVDLSPHSIAHAKQYENPNLKFHVHDMRNDFGKEYFDHILNLFTSFGYFKNEKDNILVLKNVHRALKKQGTAIIDFMNANKAIETMVEKEEKEMDGIEFHINRWVDGIYIKKQINIIDQEKEFVFEERVQALKLEDFKSYFEKARLKLIRTFGDYDLNEFDEKNSNRLIIIVKIAH